VSGRDPNTLTAFSARCCRDRQRGPMWARIGFVQGPFGPRSGRPIHPATRQRRGDGGSYTDGSGAAQGRRRQETVAVRVAPCRSGERSLSISTIN
jgi:hypothetical protein